MPSSTLGTGTSIITKINPSTKIAKASQKTKSTSLLSKYTILDAILIECVIITHLSRGTTTIRPAQDTGSNSWPYHTIYRGHVCETCLKAVPMMHTVSISWKSPKEINIRRRPRDGSTLSYFSGLFILVPGSGKHAKNSRYVHGSSGRLINGILLNVNGRDKVVC